MPETGQKYIVEISSDGNSFTTIGKMTSFDINRTKETIETNNFDSPDDAESIAGMKSWGIDGEALYVYDDAGQALVEAAYASNDPYTFKLTSAAGTAGVFEYTGEGHVTEATISGATNEVVTYTLSVEGTGTLTRAEIST